MQYADPDVLALSFWQESADGIYFDGEAPGNWISGAFSWSPDVGETAGRSSVKMIMHRCRVYFVDIKHVES